MGADETALQFLLFDRRRPTRTFDGPQIATVVSTATGTCMVTVDGYSGDVAFGPAPYPAGAATPTAGTKCLVLFVGSGVDSPHIVAFY